jgi:hypothetical protein
MYMAPRIKDAYEVLHNNADMVDAVIFTDVDKNKAWFLRNDMNTTGKVRRVYDLETIRKLPANRRGERKNPFTRKSFGPNNVLPLKKSMNAKNVANARGTLVPEVTLGRLMNMLCSGEGTPANVTEWTRLFLGKLERRAKLTERDIKRSLCLPPRLFRATMEHRGSSGHTVAHIIRNKPGFGYQLLCLAANGTYPLATMETLIKDVGISPIRDYIRTPNADTASTRNARTGHRLNSTFVIDAAVLGYSKRRSHILNMLVKYGAPVPYWTMNWARARLAREMRKEELHPFTGWARERRESQRVVDVLEKFWGA